MFEHLQIYDDRERWMVGTADLLLAAAVAPVRLLGRRAPVANPGRVLMLRLERIGDLLMALPAVAAVRALAPDARLDLVVGGWNEAVARLVPHVDRVEVLDAPWLSRSEPAASVRTLAERAAAWRRERYDLAINFEGDIRSNLLLWRSGAPRRFGFGLAGGGPLLTDVQGYDPSRHVADNLLRLVERAFGRQAHSLDLVNPRLAVPSSARARAASLLGRGSIERNSSPLIGVNVGGGRDVKQWDPARFGELVARLAAKHRARFVFTGATGDRSVVSAALAAVGQEAEVIDLAGQADLLTLAALLEQCDVFVTGDTGPMHLAAAVGTRLVAIFGPSDPRRWGPLSADAEIVHSTIACCPCNRIRRPPAHCAGHVPECLAAVAVTDVVSAVERQLARADVVAEAHRERP